MTWNLMMIISGGVAFGMAIVALAVATLAYAKVVGMEKSTHKVQWVPIPGQPAVNEDKDGNEIQDLPKGLREPKPKTIMEQMAEFGYPNVEEEQI